VLHLRWDTRYILFSVANSSQFIVTLARTEWLDGKHQIFGRVMSGMKTVREMNKRGSKKGRTVGKVVIANCGTL
jgi:cyclophilin family peptidyl-prolyl cis-trans isomerase